MKTRDEELYKRTKVHQQYLLVSRFFHYRISRKIEIDQRIHLYVGQYRTKHACIASTFGVILPFKNMKCSKKKYNDVAEIFTTK